MNPDLRSFLQALAPEQIERIRRPVALDFEVPVLQEKLALRQRWPVLFCQRVEGSDLPLVSGLFGSYDLLGRALGGVDRKQLGREYLRREAGACPPLVVRDAPVQQVVLRGDQADLTRLPIGRHAELDSGRYLTIGCLVCRDPDSGVVNVGCYRHELKGPRRLGCMINPANDAAYIYRKYRDRGQSMEVAIFVGHHPAAVMGALSRAGFGNSEYDVMGALLGEPLEVVRAVSVDLPVPASAEIVIEGVIQPDREEMEGPFGEYTGYYGPPKRAPVVEVSALTRRCDAIFHDLDPAHREHFMSSAPAKEGQVLRRVQSVVPSVRAVHLPPSACCLYHVYLSIDKRVAGEGRWAGLVALGCNHNFKHVVVVDDDVDVFDEAEVLWAVATRMEGDQDLTVIPRTMGAHLDPTSYGESRSEEGPMTTRLVVDATRPVGRPFAERVRPPREVWDRVRLEDYLEAGG